MPHPQFTAHLVEQLAHGILFVPWYVLHVRRREGPGPFPPYSSGPLLGPAKQNCPLLAISVLRACPKTHGDVGHADGAAWLQGRPDVFLVRL